MSAPKVSVLMSVKNGLPYIRSTVESILSQTYNDWEFVICDNASTDNTVEYLRDVSAKDPRIHLILNEKDLGHSGGLNKGLAACRGEWIARIDADDNALPQRLEKQIAFIQENPDIKATSCLAYYIDENGKRVGKTHHDLVNREAFRRYIQENEAIGLLHPGALIDRKAMTSCGGYRPDYDPANDIDLWARIVEQGGIILVQPEILMEYRVHGGSIVTSSFINSRLKYEWARTCMIARRSGEPEPSYGEFKEQQDRLPFWKKANRWRKISAKALYRKAAFNYITGHRLSAAVAVLLATLFQPSHTLPRICRQWLK